VEGTRRLLVVDADPGSRATITEALRRAGYATTMAETGEQALAIAEQSLPAMVILETHLPGASGYEICRELREAYGDMLPIVFISATRTEETDQVVGLLLGADDYLPKPIRVDLLLARVRRLMAQAAPAAALLGAPLTPREHEVLELLTGGLRADEIAARLVITPKTVAKHIERILGKLGVHSRAEAVAVALRRGRGIEHRPA
jgi:two-component system nitrate/nitrite response regulator NarL